MVKIVSPFDKMTVSMSPCTTRFMRGMDYLQNKPGAFASTRLMGPLALFPLLADAALHITASALKAIYCSTTATAELAVNAFTTKWKSVNPLNTYYWNKWQVTRHLTKAVQCIGMSLLAVPLGLASPKGLQSTVRTWSLAKPAPRPEKKVPEKVQSPLMSGLNKVLNTVTNTICLPIDLLEGVLERFPNVCFTVQSLANFFVIGVGVHYGPQIMTAVAQRVHSLMPSPRA